MGAHPRPPLCYLVQAVNYLIAAGRPGMAFTLFSYALANVGLAWDFVQQGAGNGR